AEDRVPAAATTDTDRAHRESTTDDIVGAAAEGVQGAAAGDVPRRNPTPGGQAVRRRRIAPRPRRV
ncbi:MAG: hypothetical protein ACM3Q0_06355, partial [Bacteroidota bacterium]